ncbi:hypothetical protein WJX77_009757 [Trebouxia sp. C0004]
MAQMDAAEMHTVYDSLRTESALTSTADSPSAGPLAGGDDVQVNPRLNLRRNKRRGQAPSSIESDEDVMGKMTQDSKEAGVAATDATNQPSKAIPVPAAKKKRGRPPTPNQS